MSIFNDEILKTVVTINTANSKGELSCVGTGFLVSYPAKAEENRSFTFMITNKHVLENVTSIVISVNKKSGGVEHFNLNKENLLKKNHLLYHPNKNIDICAIGINIDVMLEAEGNVKRVDIFNQALNISKMKSFHMVEGHPVYSVGFPMNLVEINSKNPIVRGGIISRISNLYDKKRQEQIYLIDSFNFPGNSGSPIFSGIEANHFPGWTPINTNYLIGVLNSYISYKEYLKSTQTNQIKTIEEQNSGLTNVISVDHIIELIESFPHIIVQNIGSKNK